MGRKKGMSGEKIEREILRFLAKNKKEAYSVKEIQKNIGIGYPASLKYVDLLNAKGLINVEDYGCLKRVSWKGKVKKEGLKSEKS